MNTKNPSTTMAEPPRNNDIAPLASSVPTTWKTRGEECSGNNDNDDHHEQETPPTYITRLVMGMKDCLTQLNAKHVTFPRLETMAVFIHESMSNSSRNYHSVQHVFDISEDLDDPLAILSAFFHDCIYCQIDGGISKLQEKWLYGTFHSRESLSTMENNNNNNNNNNDKNNNGKRHFSDRVYYYRCSRRVGGSSENQLLQMVERIFGFEPGQEITVEKGLNEFLSAVVAVRQLNEHLELEQLAQIACCIENTIPFRTNILANNNNINNGLVMTPLDVLYQNMQKTRTLYNLKLTDRDLIKSVQRAVIVANNDVGNFCTDDLGYFIDHTWSLLPETNLELRERYLYTVGEFHLGVFRTYKFFTFIKPKVIFGSFKGVPSEEIMAKKLQQCTRNLELGKAYVGAKLLATGVLAAFAELTGGDAPMSLFLGDLPSRQHMVVRQTMAFPLPPTKEGLKNHCNEDVYNVLVNGRRHETDFDIRKSPLAAYLYGCLGDEKVSDILTRLKWHPMDRENALELLSTLPLDSVIAIAKSISKFALSRIDAINDVVVEISGVNENNATSL